MCRYLYLNNDWLLKASLRFYPAIYVPISAPCRTKEGEVVVIQSSIINANICLFVTLPMAKPLK